MSKLRALRCWGLGALLGCFTSPALADESGFELGGRLGYGIPWGSIGNQNGEERRNQGSLDLERWVSGQVPLQLDLGYRVGPRLFVGGFFSYGFGVPGDNCERNAFGSVEVACSASVMRLGAELVYHFTPVTLDNAAWLGGGVGFEWLHFQEDYARTYQGHQTIELQLSGFELLNVQGGYDVVVSDTCRVGPYAMLTLARYSDVTVDVETNGRSLPTRSQEIAEKQKHGWIVFGVKGTFGPF